MKRDRPDKKKVQEAWERFLNPDALRPNLMVASVFLAVFEMLKQSIIERIEHFFLTGFNSDGWIIDPKYKAEVLTRHKSPLYASLDWLREHNAIDQIDIASFERVRKCRNEIAHEMLRMLSEGIGEERAALFTEMVRLLRKIETWWIVNVEIPTNPDIDGADVDESGIVPGPLVTVQLMLEIALGTGTNGPDWYYNEFRKQSRTGPQ